MHMCQHCDGAPCMSAAPEAVYKRDDGLVIIDPSKAKGHKELVEACPYGAIFWNEELEIPQKCTGCAHLVDAGEIPHCVDVCPHGAIRFGDEEEFAEELEQAEALMPERADRDRPRMHYLNLPKRFLAGVVIDPEEDEVLIGAKVTARERRIPARCWSTRDRRLRGLLVPPGALPVTGRCTSEAEGYMTRMVEASTVDEDRNMGPVSLYAAS